MTYPLFAEEWHLTHTVTTGVFAIYPIVVAAVLVGFGDVSDYVGRRTAILWGVGASLVGALLFALARDVLWLFAGRAFMGIGVGLGGLETINSAAPPEHRGGVLSAILLLAYVSLGAVSLLLGAVATAHGLGFAVNLGAGVIALFSVITVALVAMTRAGSFQIAIPSKGDDT
jgi:MFS family permease